MSKKPNIVFFFTDDQRFDTIAALGNELIKTPNIDRLVKSGTTFTHAHIPCGTSPAVCMPSRAMLNTGRTLFHIQDAGQEIPDEHALLGEVLKDNGYRTFGTGKWHNGKKAFNRSFTDGAEILFGGMADHWNVPVYNYDLTCKYDAVCPEVKNPGGSNEVTLRQCDHINVGKHSSEMVCDAALDFINGHEGEEPFYTYISFLAPHDPRTMPEKFRKMYDPEDIPLPPNFKGGHPFDTGAIHIRDEMLADFPRCPDETKRHIAEYYAMISHLDYELGRVIDCLEEKGVTDETIFVFSGDNGLAVGQHGLFGKQNCYEHSVRVPLIISGPGIKKGIKSDSLVYLFDIFPTLCELVGIDTPKSVEGQSFANGTSDRESMYFAYMEFQRAVRQGDYKLIEYVIEGRHIMTQLFDTVKDPWELENLADNPEFKDQLKLLQKEMIRLRDEWDDLATPWGEAFWGGYKNG